MPFPAGDKEGGPKRTGSLGRASGAVAGLRQQEKQGIHARSPLSLIGGEMARPVMKGTPARKEEEDETTQRAEDEAGG